jgi:hypothetical protein
MARWLGHQRVDPWSRPEVTDARETLDRRLGPSVEFLTNDTAGRPPRRRFVVCGGGAGGKGGAKERMLRPTAKGSCRASGEVLSRGAAAVGALRSKIVDPPEGFSDARDAAPDPVGAGESLG